jgi:hypothetical protein
MLNKSILEVEKKRNVFIDQIKLVENWSEKEIVHFLRKNVEKFVELEAKLSTLKKYQAKFDRLKELLKQKKCHGRNFIGETEECFEREWNECIDELSSREGKE